MTHPRGTSPDALADGVDALTLYEKIVSFLLPMPGLDLEVIIITHWWIILVALLVTAGTAEYIRTNWQVWCDRRRIRCYREKCKARKALQQLLGHYCNRQQPAMAAAAADAAVTLLRQQGSRAGSRAPTPSAPPAAAPTASLRAVRAGDHLSSVPAPPYPQPLLRSPRDDGGERREARGRREQEEARAAAVPDHDASRVRAGVDDEQDVAVVSGGDVVATTASRSHRGGDVAASESSMIRSSSEGVAAAVVSAVETNTANPGSVPGLIPVLKPTGLLGRLTSLTTPRSPDGMSTDGDGSFTSEYSTLMSLSPFAMMNTCFPRYSDDEQRSIKLRRQENENDWNEARRALESTEGLQPGAAETIQRRRPRSTGAKSQARPTSGTTQTPSQELPT